MKTLEQLYAEHSGKVSDKWSAYLTEYEGIFEEYRDKPVRLLEIGIQNGGSLEIWSRFFPHARKLVGCDINPDCARLSYEDPRIALVVGDANSDAAQAAILEHAPAFDIIIDDGSHRSSDIVKSFARYFPCLADGGVYAVEDLHCSYWREFEGGLYDPFSSITFFKRLADIINHEHWGIGKPRADILSGFFSTYAFHMAEEALQIVHSVQFMNSICVIRKDCPERNRLNARVIAGSEEMMEPGCLELHLSHSASFDQASNEWTARSMPPGEELPLRINELAERDAQVTGLEARTAELNHLIAERDGSIVGLNRAVAERDAEIDRLRRDLSAAATTVTERDAEIANLQGAVAERDQRIEKLHHNLSAATAALAERDAEIERLAGELSTAQAGIAERERQIHAIYNSTSWRLSVPIRWVGTGLRIIRRALALTRWKRPTSTTDVSRRKALSKTE